MNRLDYDTYHQQLHRARRNLFIFWIIWGGLIWLVLHLLSYYGVI